MTVWLVPIPLRTKHRWLSWVLLPCFFAKSCTAPSASLLNHLATVCACRTTSLVLERRGSKLGMISPSNLREIAKQLRDSKSDVLQCYGVLHVTYMWKQCFQTHLKPKTNQKQTKLQLGPEFQQCRQANPSWGQLLHLKCDFENLWNTFCSQKNPQPWRYTRSSHPAAGSRTWKWVHLGKQCS